jgi:PD-(D/E)XK endonuclease
MKKRKPKISDKKLRGEWAEMVFMTRATELGLPVSKPWGESRSYDFVVGRPGYFVAVQVKSTTFELDEGYICSVAGNKPYPLVLMTFSQLMSFMTTPGTSSPRPRFGAFQKSRSILSR